MVGWIRSIHYGTIVKSGTDRNELGAFPIAATFFESHTPVCSVICKQAGKIDPH